MRRKYLDVMTLIQKFEKSEFFFTMTCNPNWPEIKEHLIQEEETQNMPNLLARVFYAKLEQLKDKLLKKFSMSIGLKIFIHYRNTSVGGPWG